MLWRLVIFPGILVALGLAFWAGRLARQRDRIAVMLAIFAAPILLYTLLLFSLFGLATGSESAASLWLEGLADAALPLGLWATAAIGGFAIGRARRRVAD